MPQVMEPLVWKTGRGDRALEGVQHVGGVERRPYGGGEDGVSLSPAWASGDAFLELTAPLNAQCGHDLVAQTEGALGALGLRFAERSLMPVAGMSDCECGGLEVDVLPA